MLSRIDYHKATPTNCTLQYDATILVSTPRKTLERVSDINPSEGMKSTKNNEGQL